MRATGLVVIGFLLRCGPLWRSPGIQWPSWPGMPGLSGAEAPVSPLMTRVAPQGARFLARLLARERRMAEANAPLRERVAPSERHVGGYPALACHRWLVLVAGHHQIDGLVR